MSTEPLVRARHCQEWLVQVSQEDEPWRSRFEARLPTQTRDTIVGAARTAWLPMQIHVTLADVLEEAFGIVRAHQYYRRAFAASLRGPLLGPLMHTAVRILGLSPATFVRWAPRGWDAAFKDAGSIVGEVLGPNHARILYRDLPATCTASDAWLKSAQGSAYGALDVLRTQGVIRVALAGRDLGRMALEIEWTSRASASDG
jgi:hypothetical protein